MTADAKQTGFCAYLSAILLAGFLLNAVFGSWWADPIAGLIMVPIIAKEGVDGFHFRFNISPVRNPVSTPRILRVRIRGGATASSFSCSSHVRM
jgi:hypothetical protein